MSSVTSNIKELYEKLLDSRNGYQECAEKVADLALKQKAQQLAAKRQVMLEELRQTANELSQAAETSGSTAAAMHRVFIDLKALLTGGDTQAIINEIERGEGLLINIYQEIYDSESLPNPLRELVQRHLNEIKEDLTSIQQEFKIV